MSTLMRRGLKTWMGGADKHYRHPKLFTLCAELPKFGACHPAHDDARRKPVHAKVIWKTPLLAGVGSRVYRKSWADKGYDPTQHNILITRVGMVCARRPHSDHCFSLILVVTYVI